MTLQNSQIPKLKFNTSTVLSKFYKNIVLRLIEQFGGFRINILTEPSYNVEEIKSEEVIYLGDEKPVILKPSQKSRSRGNSESKTKQQKNTHKGKITDLCDNTI